MALAEGSLDESAVASARAEIEACLDCARDLELQVLAMSALRSMPHTELTEFESAKLRRDIRSELGVFQEEVKFEPTKRRRRFPIAAFATAAAVLVAVVAVAPRLSLVGGADSADTVALEAAESTASSTTAAFDQGAAGLQPAAEQDMISAATTAAPMAATTTALPPGAALDLLGYYAANPDLAQLRSSLRDQDFEPESVRQFARLDAGETVPEEDLRAVNSCLVRTLTTSDEFVEGFQFARGNYDGQEVIFYVYLATDPSESAVVVQAADTCEELARAGP